MVFADWSTDIAHLQTLIIVAGVLTGLFLFRPQIRRLIDRITRVNTPGGLSVETPPAELEATEDSDEVQDEQGETEEEEPDKELENAQRLEEVEEALGSDNKQELTHAMVTAATLKAGSLAERALQRLRAVETDAREQKLNEARYYWVRGALMGEDDARAELARLAEDPDIRGWAKYFIGLLLQEAGQMSAAAAAFAEAVDCADTPWLRAQCLANQAESLVALGQLDTAIALLETELANEPEDAEVLWKQLAAVYGANNQKALRALALQQVLLSAAHDTSTRFEVAYALSESSDGTVLAPAVMYHYRKVVDFNPESDTAHNNLGVAYRSADMPIHSIASYQEARHQGNTLAAANLARVLMTAGFADEAEDVLDEARQAEAPHRNVGTALAALHDQRESESKRLAELSERGQRQSEFLARYMSSHVRPGSEFFGATWSDDRAGVFVVSETNGHLTAEWEVKESKRRLTGVAHGATARVEYSEMEYWVLGGKLTEREYQKKAEEWWVLASGHKSVDVMRLQGTNTTFTQFVLVA